MPKSWGACFASASFFFLAGCVPNYERAQSAFSAGRYEEALRFAEQEVSDRNWLLLGRIHAKMGQDDTARKSLNQCVESQSSSVQYIRPLCLQELGRIEFRSGNVDRAVSHYRQAHDLQKMLAERKQASPEYLPSIQADLNEALEEQKRRRASVEQPSKTTTASEPASEIRRLDLAFWDSIKMSTSPSDFRAYLQKFPNGTFAALAKARIAALGEAPVRLTPIAMPATGGINFGAYHALVIGINSYRSVTPLKTAVNDAKAIAGLLQGSYGFRVSLLLDPTRNQMLDAFDHLRRTLQETDNLLIYYAGHGHLDADSDRGFWLPVDAEANRRANWLSNSDVADMVRATRAKHVLVVADSCYAGTLTRSLSVQMSGLDDFSRLAQKRARTALVSGGMEPVEDAGGGSHSVFAKAFLDQLRSNTGVVDMSQIFSALRRQVILSASQTPLYGDIRQTGHEGGDFIFVRLAPHR